MAVPTKVEQRYGVVDGPGGYAWVVVPDDRGAAHELNLQHGRQFWCSTLAGGCGAQLSLRVGDKKVPHFSHYPGQARSCPFAYDFDALERSYLHLALQMGLRRWLAEQGLVSTLEHTLPDGGGRADLHVLVTPGKHTIEVQLSPLQLDAWEGRTRRYRRHVDSVSWLFGPQSGRHLFAASIRLQGYALGVRLSSQCEIEAADPATIQIGTQARARDMEWVPLTSCAMTKHGIETPQMAAVINEHRERMSRGTVVEWNDANKEAHGRSGGRWSSQPDHSAFQVRHAQLPQDSGELPAAQSQAISVALTRPRGSGRGVMKSHAWVKTDRWTPPSGWEFLDALDSNLRPAARLMAYLVSRIESGGPDWTLSFPDVDDAGAIQSALEQAGLVELYSTPNGIRRWRRPE